MKESCSNRPWRILVTGTPGVGKSLFCKLLCARLVAKHLDVGAFIAEKKLFSTYDKELQCTVFDDDMLYEALNNVLINELRSTPVIVDFHSPETFPLARWFEIILVLTVSTNELYSRLEKRGYSKTKIQNNVQCEIFQTVYQDVLDYFSETELPFEVIAKEFIKEPISDEMLDRFSATSVLLRINNTSEDAAVIINEVCKLLELKNFCVEL